MNKIQKTGEKIIRNYKRFQSKNKESDYLSIELIKLLQNNSSFTSKDFLMQVCDFLKESFELDKDSRYAISSVIEQYSKSANYENTGSKEDFSQYLDGTNLRLGSMPIGGKIYLEPQSYESNRTRQVLIQLSNLILSRLTSDIKEHNKVTQVKAKQIKEPIEVQISLVGQTLLINTNNRDSEEFLFNSLRREGLKEYIFANNQNIENSSTLRRKRDKLKRSLKFNRHWQMPSYSQPRSLGQNYIYH